MMNLFLAVMNGDNTFDFSNGAIASILSIIMVFVILLIIIGITTLIFKITGLFELKKELDEYKDGNVKKENPQVITKSTDIKDDDMMVAVLIASIDYQEEIGKDVKLVSVKEIK